MFNVVGSSTMGIRIVVSEHYVLHFELVAFEMQKTVFGSKGLFLLLR